MIFILLGNRFCIDVSVEEEVFLIVFLTAVLAAILAAILAAKNCITICE